MKIKMLLAAIALLTLAGCKEPVNLDTDTRQLVRVTEAEQGRLVQRLAHQRSAWQRQAATRRQLPSTGRGFDTTLSNLIRTSVP